MAVLLDSGILYAYYDRSDLWHRAAVELVRAELGGLLLPSPVVPEVDHLLGARLGREARHLFYRGLVEASYLLVDLPQERVARVQEIDAQFAELELGFVDSAVVALTESTGVKRVATADRRHFEPLARTFQLQLVPPPPEVEG
ncbi:MAG: type II toxin-antitoxin system VapC family toxin [Thermoanaerobaculia bacterium]